MLLGPGLEVVAFVVVDLGDGRGDHCRVDDPRRPSEVRRVGRLSVVVAVGRVDVEVELELLGGVQR